MAYLGMRDDRLPVAASDLVPRERVVTYPTNFAAMRQVDLDALAGRGEQLIRTLLPYYCPELLTDQLTALMLHMVCCRRDPPAVVER